MLLSVIRNLLVVILGVIFIAATVITLVPSAGEPTLLAATGVLALFGTVQTVQWLREFGSPLPKRRPRQAEKIPATTPAEAEREYLNGRLDQFAAEQKLFVRTELTTELQPRFRTEGETKQETFDDIERAVELHQGRFVLVGDPGAGKSTALRHRFTAAAQRYLAGQEHRLPLWINLGLSTNPVQVNPEVDYDLLHHWWHEQCFLPGGPLQYLRQRKLSLFLDGLNEMPESGGSRKERAAALRAFIESHPDLPVIVTCRVRDYEDDDDLKLGLSEVYVQPLDDTRIKEFIARRGAPDTLWEAIAASDPLLHLARNPYNLVMLLSVYQETGGLLPASLNDLYRDYLRVTHERYTRERSIRRDGDPDTELLRLKLPELERRLRRLAFLMIARGKGTAAEYDWAGDWRQGVGRTALRDGLNLGVLLREGDNIRFYHQSLHGYFAVEPLSRALSVRGFARLAQNPVALIRQIGDLGEAGAPAVEPLIGALHDADVYVRRAAADALGWIGDARALEPLIEALRDPHVYVRRFAAGALGRIGDGRAVEPLNEALRDPDRLVRWNAADALGRIGVPAVEPLIGALRGSDVHVRRAAARALGRIGDARAVQSLIDALHDPDRDVRSNAAEALVRIGAPAVEPLIEALRDPDRLVRGAAASALGRIGDTRAVEPLIGALRDPDAFVRGAAARALGEIGDSRAVEPLIGALHDPDRLVRIYTAGALGRIGDGRAVEALIAALRDPDRPVRYAAARALGEIGDSRAVESLIGALRDPDAFVRGAAARALGEIGDSRAVEPLIGALRDPDAFVRRAVAYTLGKIGDARAVPSLKSLLGDTNKGSPWDKRVCDYAAEALERIGTPEALAAVAEWRRNLDNP